MEAAALWARLERVLDPELDESIVRLGFVARLDWDGRRAAVTLRLPTYWCSPNFAYLMADGVRQALLTLPGVEAVAVRVEDHFVAEELSAGVTAGHGFGELFPAEAAEDLDELRQRFLVKGYLSRLLVLASALRAAGLDDAALASTRLGDLQVRDGQAWVRAPAGERGPLRGSMVERYLERRSELGLPMTPDAPLLARPDGQAIPPATLREELRRMRTTVINLRASAALCTALLESRQRWWSSEREEAMS